MKFIIKHEIKGHMRVHLLQNRMTFEQADTLLYYLSSQKLVTGVKVREKHRMPQLILWETGKK